MSIGKIGEFDATVGNWTLYVERLEMYFKVNSIEKGLWLPTLIAVIGEGSYELLSNLVSPKKPADMEYAAVTEVMRKHLQPKQSVMAERYRFRQRRQASDEKVSQYISELKKLSKYCDFAATLEDNLRDQIVCGLRSDLIRQRLFAEDNLTYESAVKLASALEAAERDAAVVEQAGASVAGTVHALSARSEQRGRGRSGHAGAGAGRAAAAARGPSAGRSCAACGSHDHADAGCRFRNYVCRLCGNKGHLKRACPERARRPGGPARHSRVHGIEASGAQEDTLSEDSEREENVHQLCLNSYRPVSITVMVDDVPVKMEVDTGAAVSCVSKLTYLKYFKHNPIEKTDVVFRFYDGTKMRPVGTIKPMVKYKNKSKYLELFIVEGGSTSLIGRHWLAELGIKIPACQQIDSNMVDNCKLEGIDLSILMDRYKELFSGGLGRFTGGMATLRVREGAVPVYCRARPLPYAVKDQVDAQLDDMLREGIIEPVNTSEWATPLVPVRKADGGLRICADYKVTLNPALLVDRFPLPRVEDLLVGLNGAQVFSKIDLSQAYNQIELDESKEFTVINTHRGLFKYNRLVFGLSSSPGIFQRIMTNLFNDIPNVECFLDDVIIATKDEKQHLITLDKVFHRLHSHGLKLKKSKCLFMADEVRYLGYIISKDGLKVDPGKVEAITKIPRPSNVNEVRSFLGLVNFYAKFVKNISTILAPLYRLLQKKVEWQWSDSCELAFNKIKNILTSAEVLVHYDPNKQLIVTCDASSHGVGGVLTQPGGAGAERPVAYVSRSLTDAEKNYSQIDKEALAIVFCLEKLHQYLYGRKFTLRTDHKPLVSIFGPKVGVPAMAASRLQRWAIKLSAYTYDIEYVNTKLNGADGLSRLPLKIKIKPSTEIPEQTYLHFAQDAMLLDYEVIKKFTHRDPMLSRLLVYLRNAWPKENEVKTMQPFFNRKEELYEELGCIMWGHRVVVPEGCRGSVLAALHEAHMGIVKTKALARSYVWWPGVDEAVEALCRACAVCAAEADAPPRHAPSLWPWPTKPWSRIHVDFLGPFLGKIYLVMVDARTKWIEAFEVPSTAAQHTITKLSETFARWGLPKQIVSDNGPPFTSTELSSFLDKSGIEHTFAAPYHPASNGAAENAVRTIKRVIKKAARQKINISEALNTFLLYYRNVEHSTTGASPAALMLGRQVRTKLDALRPDCEGRVRAAQRRQAAGGGAPAHAYRPGDPVWVRQHQGPARWVPGEVSEQLGNRNYKTVDSDGKSAHRHVDQLRRRPRSSLICPNIPSEQESSPSEIHPGDNTIRGTDIPEGEDPAPQLGGASDDTSAPEASVGPPEAVSVAAPLASPPPPVAPPPRTRPRRECRVDPSRYKI